MPIPDFVVALRKKIGQDELWLPSVTGLVLDGQDRVLLVQRRDNRLWTLVTGIGAVLGPGIGGWLLARGGPDVLFLALAVVYAVTAEEWRGRGDHG